MPSIKKETNFRDDKACLLCGSTVSFQSEVCSWYGPRMVPNTISFGSLSLCIHGHTLEQEMLFSRIIMRKSSSSVGSEVRRVVSSQHSVLSSWNLHLPHQRRDRNPPQKSKNKTRPHPRKSLPKNPRHQLNLPKSRELKREARKALMY